VLRAIQAGGRDGTETVHRRVPRIDQVRVFRVRLRRRRVLRRGTVRDRACVLRARVEDVAAGRHDEDLVVLGELGAGRLVFGVGVVGDAAVVVDGDELATGEAAVLVRVVDDDVEDVALVVGRRRSGCAEGAVGRGRLGAVRDPDVDGARRDSGRLRGDE